jgi:hypothetical protein
MNKKRLILAAIAVFLVYEITNPIIHGFILGKAYMALNDIWRTDMMSKMWIMHITNIIFSFLFVYIFSKGYENKGILEGVRFGIIIGLLITFIGIFNQYVVYPIPATLAIQWFIYGMVQFVIFGITTSLIYKRDSE